MIDLNFDMERWTYGEDGRLLEYWSGYLTRYTYRSDGQVEGENTVAVADDGEETPVGTALYEYGDDDLLDRYTSDFPAYMELEYEYVLEAGRVRVRETVSTEQLWSEIFDDFGNLTFEFVKNKGYDPFMAGYVDNSWCRPSSCYRHESQRFRSGLPYRAFDLTETEIGDFSYVYSSPKDDYEFARRVTFSDEGLLEHLTLSLAGSPPKTIDFDTQRCDAGVAIETTEFSDAPGSDETRLYYYGCDDFELPSELPEL